MGYALIGFVLGSTIAIAFWVLFTWGLSLLGVPFPYLITFGIWTVLQLAGLWHWLHVEKEFTRTIEDCLDKEPPA